MLDEDQLLDHWPAMVRAARKVLGSRDEAEDCAGDAVVQVLERPQLAAAGNLEAMLVTVAKRRALDQLRIREREQRREQRLTAVRETPVEDVAHSVTSSVEEARVDAAVRQLLPAKSYELVRLIADGAAVGEAAQQLGVTKRAAESHLLRARRALREALAHTLVLIGLGAAGVRRFTTGPAVATTAASAVLVLAALTATAPGGRTAVPDGASPTAQSPASRLAEHVVVVEHPIALHAKAAKGEGSGDASSSGEATAASRVAAVSGPANTTVSVDEEEHGDGGEQGPAEITIACVQNLEISRHRIGC